MRFVELVHSYIADIAALLAMLSVIVEISPRIKINPWTWLLKIVGNKMNADLLHNISDIEVQLKKQAKEIDKNERDRIRYEILDFANSCRNRQLHTKEEFDHILEQYDKYEIIMAKLEQPNGKVNQAMKYINELYIDCQKQNDFM